MGVQMVCIEKYDVAWCLFVAGFFSYLGVLWDLARYISSQRGLRGEDRACEYPL
jgi:hypothetical protein